MPEPVGSQWEKAKEKGEVSNPLEISQPVSNNVDSVRDSQDGVHGLVPQSSVVPSMDLGEVSTQEEGPEQTGSAQASKAWAVSHNSVFTQTGERKGIYEPKTDQVLMPVLKEETDQSGFPRDNHS